MNPMDVIQNVNLTTLTALVGALSERLAALEAVLVIKSDGSVLLSGRDIEIKASGKATIKAGGHLILKAAKILQN